MAEHFPDVHVTAVDRSDELISKSSDLSNLNFQQADLYELPFPDNHFDFIYARLVFMHLTDPQKALQSLRRVLKPGGRILIEDADRDCMFFEPAPSSLADFWKKVQDGQRRLGGDPNVGRKLTPYLKNNDFININTQVQTIIGGGPDISFLVRTLLPSLNVYLLPKDRPQGELAIEDLRKLSQQDDASFLHFWFVVSGEKNDSTI
jgi:SAM-dependent methyltransferase